MSASNLLRSCHCCGLVQTLPSQTGPQVIVCHRCRSRLESGNSPGDNSLTAALALAALLIYIPAISMPFLRIERLGHVTENTLVGGTISMLLRGEWFVGLIVLTFSVIVPPTKLAALLVLSTRATWLQHHHRAVTYRLVEQLGRWGMLDVLFVAVVISFVKLGGIIEFGALPGVIVFGSFVLLSLVASCVFNPHCLWSVSGPSSVVGNQTSQSNLMGTGVPPVTNQPPATVPHPPTPPPDPPSIPVADLRPRRRSGWVWLLPSIAGVVAIVISIQVWSGRGRLIHISFAEGYSIKPNDVLRYHGIVAGSVEKVVLSDDLRSIDVHVRLSPEADQLARQGTRFWIVRPKLDLTGIGGLETVVGAKYLTALPAPPESPVETRFVGLEDQPLEDVREAGGLEIVLHATEAFGLRAGTPVLYRQLRVGGVISVGLASDGSAVEARAYIRSEFRHLIRDNTRFWNANGVRLTGGLTGFSMHVGSIETLLHAGVAFAVPPKPGELAKVGHRFTVHDKPEEEWLTWKPALHLGSLPQKLPATRPVVLQWSETSFLRTRERRKNGWVLPVADGWLGPADLLTAPANAHAGTTMLVIDGQNTPLEPAPRSGGDGLAILPASGSGHAPATITRRRPESPEDLLLNIDGTREPQFLSASRLTPQAGVWLVDPSLPLDLSWHGAVAVAAKDGAVVGLLLTDGKSLRVALLNE
ncbi:MAG: paraquat-inducible protein A [Planctomycetales bacterium]|nr:paraquat-inducible protein A [Planctomycetales bacterium]